MQSRSIPRPNAKPVKGCDRCLMLGDAPSSRLAKWGSVAQRERFSSPPLPRREACPHPAVIFRLATGAQASQEESRCVANHWLPLLGERAGVRGCLRFYERLESKWFE